MLKPFESTFCAGCLVGVPGGVGERRCGFERGGRRTAGMQYVRGPMSALSEGSDEKEEERGGELRTAVMRTAMLKQCGCRATKPKPQSHAISHTHTRFSSFSLSYMYKTLTQTPLQKSHGFTNSHTYNTYTHFTQLDCSIYLLDHSQQNDSSLNVRLE